MVSIQKITFVLLVHQQVFCIYFRVYSVCVKCWNDLEHMGSFELQSTDELSSKIFFNRIFFLFYL